QRADVQNATHSGYKKRAQLLYGCVVSPDGLILSRSPALTGRHNDNEFVTTEFMTAVVANNITLLGDSGVPSKPPHIRQIPRRTGEARAKAGVTSQDCRHASSVRIAIEHVFGHLKATFPLVFDASKNKLGSTNPEHLLTVAMVLYNCLVCNYGSQ